MPIYEDFFARSLSSYYTGSMLEKGVERRQWTFLSNHGHVLICIAQDPGVRGRDIAERVGITERATQAIIADLVDAGYVTRNRVGRRNHYQINSELPLRHQVEDSHSVGDLLQLMSSVEFRTDQP
ncbi:MAG: helix-turn-helix transcriptional regulator [Acidimicrobiales bacterium]